jgi:hypothetical protein
LLNAAHWLYDGLARQFFSLLAKGYSMKLKLALAFALSAFLWLMSLSVSIQAPRTAYADPSAVADPISGPMSETFWFYFSGFQPYTQLTLSFVPPAGSQYIVVDTPEPVITDGSGQAVAPLNLLALASADPSLAPLASFLGLASVAWTPVGGGIAYFYVAACDRSNCAESIGTVIAN